MDFAGQLENNYSKPTIMEIANYVGEDKKRFARLIDLMSGTDPVLAQRAAWALSHSLDVFPHLADPYVDLMLEMLNMDVHDGIHRCVLRSFERIDLPERLHGRIIDICFRWLMNRKAATALRIYSMTVIYRLSFIYPEIKPELDLVINEEMENGSAGFINRGRKMLKGRYRLKIKN